MIDFLIIYLVIGLFIASDDAKDNWIGWMIAWLPILFIRAIKLIHKELKS